MKKAYLFLIVLTLVVGVIFASCKPAAVTPTTAEETAATEETAVATETAAEETAKVTFDKPVTITYMTWHPANVDVDRMVKLFMDAYPNVTVEAETQLADEYFVNLKSAYAAGSPPDVAMFQPGAQITPYIQYLEPLAPMAEKEWGPDWRNKFYDFCNEQVEWTGKEYYMMPQGWTPTGIWANTRILDKYGLAIPENLADLEKIKDTVSKDGLATILCGFKDNWNAQDLFFFMLDDFAPGEFYKAEQGQSSFESKGFLDALNMWKYFFDKELVQPGAYSLNTYMESITQYQQGKGVFVPMGFWHLSLVYLTPVENAQMGGFKPFNFPDLNGDGVKPRPTVTMGNGMGLTKGLDDYKKAAAWEFIKYMVVEGESAQYYANGLWQFPASKEIVIADSVYEKAGEFAEEMKANTQWYFENAEVQGEREAKYPEIREGLYEVLSSVVTGQKNPEQALADLQKISESISR
ncbi:MAG: extracellular solute-binding protein [Actinobacteria bacterium]|nr:extracellular solute-binding protein [Actinomycetota bacterium]